MDVVYGYESVSSHWRAGFPHFGHQVARIGRFSCLPDLVRFFGGSHRTQTGARRLFPHSRNHSASDRIFQLIWYLGLQFGPGLHIEFRGEPGIKIGTKKPEQKIGRNRFGTGIQPEFRFATLTGTSSPSCRILQNRPESNLA